MTDRSLFIANRYFIGGLLLLVLNDHYLKWEFHNWFTGKLSDVVGVFILPFFIAFVLKGRARIAVIFTALFFIWWKSSISTSAIELYNEFAIIPICRIVDYTDYFALAMLPISYLTIRSLEYRSTASNISLRWFTIPLGVMSCFVFMATSPPLSYYRQQADNGSLKLYSSKKISLSKEEILEELELMGIKPYRDSILQKEKSYDSMEAERAYVQLIEADSLNYMNEIQDSLSKYNKFKVDVIKQDASENIRFINNFQNYYKIDEIVIDMDTIRNFQFSLEEVQKGKTVVYINGIDFPHSMDPQVFDAKANRYYRKLLKRYLKSRLNR